MLRTGPRVSRWHTCGFVTTAIAVLVAVAVSTAQVTAVRGPVATAAEIVSAVLPQVASASIGDRTIGADDVAPMSALASRRKRVAAPHVGTNPEPQHEAARHESPQSMPMHPPNLPSNDTPPLDSSSAVPKFATAEFGSGPGTIVPVEMPAVPQPAQDDRGTWSQVADAGSSVGRKTSDAGVAIGRKSSDAARSTAGFFSKMGKSIAGRF